MTESPRIGIVVLNWDAHAATLGCVGNLLATVESSLRIYVVDNGSETDDRTALERGLHDLQRTHGFSDERVTVLYNDRNLGFAGGTNRGVRAALSERCRWILWLNNDTSFGRGAVDSLVDEAERLGAASAQPLIVSDDGRHIDSMGLVPRWSLGVTDAGRGDEPSRCPSGESTEIFGACGAVALFSSAALRDSGLMDDELFVLMEDVDQAFRVREHGGRAFLVPGIVFHHTRGISDRGATRTMRRLRKLWLQRNTVALALRYWPTRYLLATLPLLAWRTLQAFVLSQTTPEHLCVPMWFRALGNRRATRRALRTHGVDRWFL